LFICSQKNNKLIYFGLCSKSKKILKYLAAFPHLLNATVRYIQFHDIPRLKIWWKRSKRVPVPQKISQVVGRTV